VRIICRLASTATSIVSFGQPLKAKMQKQDGLSGFPVRTVEIGSGQQPVTLADTMYGGFDISGNTAVISIGRQITVFNLATG
jgi:hypothetical protein